MTPPFRLLEVLAGAGTITAAFTGNRTHQVVASVEAEPDFADEWIVGVTKHFCDRLGMNCVYVGSGNETPWLKQTVTGKAVHPKSINKSFAENRKLQLTMRPARRDQHVIE